jgi:rod shape-determining protein MreD
MAILSMRARTRVLEVTAAATLCWSALSLQLAVLNYFPVHGIYCNLPLTLVILWGAVFGSSVPAITPDELRTTKTSEVFLRQVASGSISGALVGAFMAALYHCMLPVYPVSYPLVGWLAGYFCLRNINKETLLCVPLVLLLTALAELLMSWQLLATGRPGVTADLIRTVPPESILNAIIAPFVYFPLRHWYERTHAAATPVQSE